MDVRIKPKEKGVRRRRFDHLSISVKGNFRKAGCLGFFLSSDFTQKKWPSGGHCWFLPSLMPSADSC